MDCASFDLQGQGSSPAGKQSNGGGTGMASVAEQAAQRAANRGKPPVPQVNTNQYHYMHLRINFIFTAVACASMKHIVLSV